MERFWNIIHYFVYKTDYKFHLLFNKINPFVLIHKLPFQKRIYEKKGINIRNEINKAFRNPNIGISIIRAGGFMHILVFLTCFGVINFFSGLIQQELNLKLYHFIIILFITLLVNYFLLFKQKKYRNYFKQFETMPVGVKKKWAWISFLVIVCILIFSISSFVFLDYRL
jgi:hypothetical protein